MSNENPRKNKYSECVTGKAGLPKNDYGTAQPAGEVDLMSHLEANAGLRTKAGLQNPNTKSNADLGTQILTDGGNKADDAIPAETKPVMPQPLSDEDMPSEERHAV